MRGMVRINCPLNYIVLLLNAEIWAADSQSD